MSVQKNLCGTTDEIPPQQASNTVDFVEKPTSPRSQAAALSRAHVFSSFVWQWARGSLPPSIMSMKTIKRTLQWWRGMHISPSCSMCSSTQPSVETATVTTDSAVIDRYTHLRMRHKHTQTRQTFRLDKASQFPKIKKHTEETSLGLLKGSHRTSRNFAGASAVHSARAVPSSESKREDVKKLAKASLVLFFRWRLAGAGARKWANTSC